MELQVRNARITDVDGITTLLDRAHHLAAGSDGAPDADLLRQLIYLPNATVVVALDGRRVVGIGVLALRPSVVRGGLIGTVDLLSVDSNTSSEHVAGSLLAEVLRSARNKGCVAVEAEPGGRDTPRWMGWGFREGERRLELDIAAGGLHSTPRAREEAQPEPNRSHS